MPWRLLMPPAFLRPQALLSAAKAKLPASPTTQDKPSAFGVPSQEGPAAILARALPAERTLVTVFNKGGVRVDLTSTPDKKRGLAVAADVWNATEAALVAVNIQVAVPRYLQFEMSALPETKVTHEGARLPCGRCHRAADCLLYGALLPA